MTQSVHAYGGDLIESLENHLAGCQPPFLEEDIETQASSLFPASCLPRFISHPPFREPRRKKVLYSKIVSILRSHTVPSRKLQKEQNSRWCLFICGSNPIRTNYHFFGLMRLLGILKESTKTTWSLYCFSFSISNFYDQI